MPIYEYECENCKDPVEIIQGINDAAKRKCPECGGKIKRMVSRNSFQLKGGGWYKDGYSSASGGSGSSGGEAK